MTEPTPPRVRDAEFLAGAMRFEQLPPSAQAEVAFVGRSNVGKSSLMNALLQRHRLVRTSSTPGCTRQISLFGLTTRGGANLTWVDLPGYGYAKRSKGERGAWAELIDSYLLGRPNLAVVVSLVDVRRGVQDVDRALLELVAKPARIQRAPLQVLLVATKWDKVAASKRKAALDELRRSWPGAWLGFSTEMRQTHQPIWSQILRCVDIES